MAGYVRLGSGQAHHIQIHDLVLLPHGNRGLQHSLFSHLNGEHPGVHVAQSRPALIQQELIEGFVQAVMSRTVPVLPADHGPGPHPVRLKIVPAHPIITLERISEQQHLSMIRGIGQRLLITGHDGCEDQFARDNAGRTKTGTYHPCTVF